jgi:hypothetical protein
VGRIAAGIDARASGGYVILTGSRHISGGLYDQKTSLRPVVMPDWLVDLASKAEYQAPAGLIALTSRSRDLGSAYGLAALRNEADRVRTAREGTRNDTLNRAAFAAGQLEASGELRPGMAENELREAAQAAGLGISEIEKTLASGLKAGRVEPRQAPETHPAHRPGGPTFRARTRKSVWLTGLHMFTLRSTN